MALRSGSQQSARPARDGAALPQRPNTVDFGINRGHNGDPAASMAVTQFSEGGDATEGGGPQRPPMSRQKTVGVSNLKARKAARANARKEVRAMDALIGRDQILASLYAVLAKADAAAASKAEEAEEEGTVPSSPDAEEADVAPVAMAVQPMPPQQPRPVQQSPRGPLTVRMPSALPSRPDSSGQRPGTSGSGGTLSAPATSRGGLPAAGGHHSAGSSRQGSATARRGDAQAPARDFLRNVLAANKDREHAEALMPETVPTWKEEIVERVRRRTAAKRAATPGSAAGARHAARRAVGGTGGDLGAGSAEGASLWGGGGGGGVGSPRGMSPRGLGGRHGGVASGLLTSGISDGSEEFGGFGSQTAQDKAMAVERELRKRHAMVGYFRDAISDLVLTSQFQEADFMHRTAQVRRLLQASSQAGGKGGRSSAHRREGSEFFLIELEKKLTAQLELLDARASDAATLNGHLERQINELRRQRADQLQMVRAREAREQAMSVDMRAFAAAAHTALDEKERVKGRMRRLRYEWKVERGTQETEQATLLHEEEDLEQRILQATAEEEAAVQDETRREALVMRANYRTGEARERRVGYLRNQLTALQMEFRKLGEVAGVAGRGTGADRFNYEDPETAGVLTRTIRSNDVRNESEHAYVQDLDAQVEELTNELAVLEIEEKELQMDEQRRKENAEAYAAKEEKMGAQAIEDAMKMEELATQLAGLRPVLTQTIDRLARHYSSLDGIEMHFLDDLPNLGPAARSTPAGMRPLTVEEMPLPTGLEVTMENLDSIVQQMASRVSRIVRARAALEPDADEAGGGGSGSKPAHAGTTGGAEGDEEGSTAFSLNPVLRVFTELPPELTFQQLKDARADLEAVVFKHKEVQGDEDAA
jgi:hypothetical protein